MERLKFRATNVAPVNFLNAGHEAIRDWKAQHTELGPGIVIGDMVLFPDGASCTNRHDNPELFDPDPNPLHKWKAVAAYRQEMLDIVEHKHANLYFNLCNMVKAVRNDVNFAALPGDDEIAELEALKKQVDFWRGKLAYAMFQVKKRSKNPKHDREWAELQNENWEEMGRVTDKLAKLSLGKMADLDGRMLPKETLG